MIRARVLAAAAIAAAVFGSGPAAGCGNSPPPVRYYQVELPEGEGKNAGEGVLAVERLGADAAYDEARIVYRENPYRLDYYHYHRWSAPPGIMLSDYLRLAYGETGLFDSVVSDFGEGVDGVLGGRVMALEEVNKTEEEWLARIRLELELRDARTGELLWTQMITETEPLEAQEPEGLARAVAKVMERIVDDTAPELSRALADRDA